MSARASCSLSDRAISVRRDWTLRAHMSAASLKPFGAITEAIHSAIPPRSHERGLIEARAAIPSAWIDHASLRAHMSAASLKQLCQSSSQKPVPAPPRSHERGPSLKLFLAQLASWRPWIPPRSHERGLIEATERERITTRPPGPPRSHERGLIEARL